MTDLSPAAALVAVLTVLDSPTPNAVVRLACILLGQHRPPESAQADAEEWRMVTLHARYDGYLTGDTWKPGNPIPYDLADLPDEWRESAKVALQLAEEQVGGSEA